MRQSTASYFIRKEVPKDEEAHNAQLLIRAGYIDKLMAGVYSFLPLGLRVLRNIENIIREEMNVLGAEELLLPVLHPREVWETTGRWESLDVLFKVISKDKREYALGPTHEEVIVPVAQKTIFSYKDLPLGLYQIQTKFRDEARAKSGLLRGREFLMKDLYSFHTSENDLEAYYQNVTQAYKTIFTRLSLDALLVEASGGSFSRYSHEFQVETETGEDSIVLCRSCSFAQNREINDAQEGDTCPSCGEKLEVVTASEVGNIFKLKTKYSEPFNLSYSDEKGESRPVIMGCYGIGVSRLMGVIAELFHDEKGLMWPSAVAPYQVHLLALPTSDEKETGAIFTRANEVYTTLHKAGISVLFDDRKDVSVGEKFVESDLVGIPLRLVVSKRTGDKIECRKRKGGAEQLVDFSHVTQYCEDNL